jgi:hypothetical protein
MPGFAIVGWKLDYHWRVKIGFVSSALSQMISRFWFVSPYLLLCIRTQLYLGAYTPMIKNVSEMFCFFATQNHCLYHGRKGWIAICHALSAIWCMTSVVSRSLWWQGWSSGALIDRHFSCETERLLEPAERKRTTRLLENRWLHVSWSTSE